MRNKKPTGDDDVYDDDNVSGNVLKSVEIRWSQTNGKTDRQHT